MNTIEKPINKLKFNKKNKPGFYAEVRSVVDAYFKENGIGKNANASMILKGAFFLSLYVGIYVVILGQFFGLWATLGLAIVLGMVQTMVGFNVGHDAIHGSYSSKKWLNKFLGYSFNLIGANSYVWEITHNRVHHTYTNIPGHDEDLEVAPGLICLSPAETPKSYMRYQQFYAFFLYGLSGLSWIFRKDFKKFFQDKVGETDTSSHPMKEYFILFFFKAIYYSLFIVIPLVVMDITWWQFLIGFLSMEIAKGVVMGLIFQLAHIVEDVDFMAPDENWQMEESWAMVQMHGTANFSTESAMATFFCGGLNFQVEHHLFPLVCHIHYPAISKLVMATAEKYDMPYNNNPTFAGALKSHYNMLKKFGRQQVA